MVTKTNKPFKSRHASKSALKARNKGKVDDITAIGHRSQHSQVMSKLDRRNKAKQIQTNKNKELVRDYRIFDGRRGAPKIVAVVPLSDDVNSAQAVRDMLKSLDIAEDVPEAGSLISGIERFKQKLQWVVLQRDILAILDGCKIADFVVFVMSANEEVDSFGETVLRSLGAQGVSNTIATVQHIESIEPAKRRPDVKKSLLSFISHFFPEISKVHDHGSEGLNVVRTLCTQHPKGVHWRDSRSYLLAEEVRWNDEEGLVIGGVVRGKGLKADRLVHIQGHGDFQIEKICAYPSSDKRRTNEDEMAVDSAPSEPEVLEVPTEEQDDLLDLAAETEMADVDISDTVSEAPTNMTTGSRKGVLLDDHHYFDDDVDALDTPYEAPKKLPKGTSSYQAAWYLDDEEYGSDDSFDDEPAQDIEVEAETNGPQPEDGEEGQNGVAMTDVGTEYGDDAKSEMFLDPSPDQELAEIQNFRSRQKELEEDREFPDEIELHPNVLARERLARYRGLKSLRTSKWDTTEDIAHQPEAWDRLANIHDYKATKNRLLREALVGGVSPGTKVLVYLRNGAPEIAEAFRPHRPFAMYSLLKHEHKQAVVNVSLTASTDYTGEPVKAKDELILQVGPRRLHINPLFSQAGGLGPNKIAKFERFIIPGRQSMATFVGPIVWGNVPAVFWKRGDGERDWEFVGHGSFQNVDRDRVVAKRIVLTGHPFQIHKKLVTVRYMFFNSEDVNWFKAIPLYTKRGRSGFIKESLGTHGYFKATFDGRINPQDAVAISLYKRVFPRGSTEMEE